MGGASPEATPPAPKQWWVSSRWLVDSDGFNEWQNEEDYELILVDDRLQQTAPYLGDDVILCLNTVVYLYSAVFNCTGHWWALYRVVCVSVCVFFSGLTRRTFVKLTGPAPPEEEAPESGRHSVAHHMRSCDVM